QRPSCRDRDRRPDRAAASPDRRGAPARRAAARADRHAPDARGGLPAADRRGGVRMSGAALLWEQYRFERRLFWRNPSAAFFNFSLPTIFLLLIASVFNTDKQELNVLVPGIAGMAV